MNRVLVIGASGLVGNRAVEIGRTQYNVWGTYWNHAVEGDSFFSLNVLDRKNVFHKIESSKPDCIIDTHALHNVDYCETHPEEAWQVNVEGTRNVAEAAKRVGAKYAFISTDYVFDGTKLIYTEKDKPHPQSYYAKTKLAAEMQLEALDINYVVARTSVVYGTGGKGKLSFVLWLIDQLSQRKQVNIVADQHNNPTYADNLCDILYRLLSLDERGIFHVTGRECVSRYDFAKRIAHEFGLDESLITPVTTPELNQVAPRPAKVNLNTSKVERVTGIKTLTVGEGLSRMKKQLEMN